MYRAYIAVTIAAIIFGVIGMYCPIMFRYKLQLEKWREWSHLKRFLVGFIPLAIALNLLLVWTNYKDQNTPTDFEKALSSGEMSYIQQMKNDEQSGAFFVYEIKKTSSIDEICYVSTEILRNDFGSEYQYATVTYDNNQYCIMKRQVKIGRIVAEEMKFGTYLYFYNSN